MIASNPSQLAPVASAPAAVRSPLPRVLYVMALDGSQKFGSLEELIWFMAQAFRAEGSLFLPVFLEPKGPGRAGTLAFESAGLPTEHLNLWTFRWKTLKRLRAIIDQHQIQQVHWNFYSPLNGYMLALSAMRPGLRHAFTDHNSRILPLPPRPRLFKRLLKRMLLKRYRRVHCISQFIHHCLTAQGCWSNLQCLLYAINTDRFRPDPTMRQVVRQQHGCEDRFVAVTVAHLIREKGVDVAIRAIAETPPNIILWVVGTGPETANLQALTAELGLGGRVTFFGQQTHVQPFMQAADCFVCPSLWAEAVGLVNIEAVSTGLPVLASRIGGIPEYIDHGRTGFLFSPGDHRALAGLLRGLHDAPEECRRIAETARATATERFSISKRINEFLDFYREFS